MKDDRRPGTGRLYHPSPNCPCPACLEQYHSAPLTMPSVEIYTTGNVTEPHPNCRCAAPMVSLPERPDSLTVDLLDMPEPDRSVLIQALRKSLKPPRRPRR